VSGWFQPAGQRFDATNVAPGGLIAARVAAPIHGVAPFIELEAKSDGWVAGNVALDAAFSVRAGLTLRVF
jgi:hypothetical protein